MRISRRQLVSSLNVVLVVLMLPSLAFGWSSPSPSAELRLAYIDPGTGSFVAQAVIAMIAGIAVTARLYWTKIKSMLGLSSMDNYDEDADTDDE